MIKAVRGTRDLLPPDTALWNHVESVVREVFRAYNFQEIRTPIFESTELFARGVGEETDIVAKEMFTWWEGDTPEIVLERSWTDQYKHLYKHIEPSVLLKNRRRADFVGHRDNLPPTIVKVEYEPGTPSLFDLQSLRKEWFDANVEPTL